MRFFPVIIALSAVAGCASPSAPTADTKVASSPATTSSDAPKQVCHREMPTGSNIPVTVCETQMSEAERVQRNIEMSNQIRQQQAKQGIGGG